ncbi:MORN repeat domain-containing protein [Phytophthora infestans]|uniref:MORN repeat domain-containing protein n=1 Tax=Phytophthora infestans TaxID=4787 RepID=A0A8S9UDM6_PHYIN|nr:MORN repeat domain-containing protein [Phytophthora infestans]
MATATWMKSPPLDPRVLANVVTSYDGETLQVPDCDVPVYHGKGRLEFKTGFTYTGDFVHGRMHGTGHIEWLTSGVVYEGEFARNEITGIGTYWWPNGSSYVGDVKCGKRHGHGVFVTGDRGLVLQRGEPDVGHDGTSEGAEDVPKPLLFAFHSPEYQGGGGESLEEMNGGEGVVVAQSNARYDGEWENGLPHGYGELTFDAARNIRYEGQFLEGKREGRGHMHYADGSVYAGDWKADVKSGQGVMTWMTTRGADEVSSANATPLERYDGEWENDCQEGFGRHVWLVNPLSGSSNKNWYEGEFHEGLRHGRGVFFYANGARYEGEWKANVKDGYGLFFYEDGRVFVGLFRQDRSVEGSYATAATAGLITPIPVESSTATSPSQPPNSAGIMLYINDLLPITDVPRREKARKAVEHAALRINTELRALYRECIKQSRRSLAPGSNDADDPGTLLELFECRQLLSQCGFYFTSGQLETYLKHVRKAQRAGALAIASSLNITEHFLDDLPTENRLKHPIDPSRLEVVPWDEQLLFREFVELLVRIGYAWVTTAETDGMITLSGSLDSAVFLVDVFSDVYDQMMRGRQKTLSQSSPTWLSLLRVELMDKNLHSIFTKHHDHLQQLYNNCITPSVLRQDEDVSEQEFYTPIDKTEPDVSVRSVLVMLRNEPPVDTPIFTPEFRIHDVLSALNRAFTASSPPLNAELLRSVASGCSSSDNQDSEPDAFFMGTTLVFSEFLDAIATVLFTKQHTALTNTRQTTEELPLCVLVDQFMQSMKMEAHRVV